jgi:hypothetical protein
MNATIPAGCHPRSQSQLRRAAGLAAAAAGIALLAAACGGSSPTASATASAYQKAIDYAQCMRSHGEPSWPDPNSHGDFMFANSAPLDPSSSAYQSANDACKKLLPNGGQMTPAQLAKATAKALQFSECMRSHGIVNFPDPTQTGNGVAIIFSQGSGIDPNSPQFQAARQACQSFSPFGGGAS